MFDDVSSCSDDGRPVIVECIVLSQSFTRTIMYTLKLHFVTTQYNNHRWSLGSSSHRLRKGIPCHSLEGAWRPSSDLLMRTNQKRYRLAPEVESKHQQGLLGGYMPGIMPAIWFATASSPSGAGGTCDRKEATQLCYEPRALGAFRMPCPYVGLDARNHVWHVHLDMHQTRTARDGKSRIKRTDGVLPIMST